MTLKTFRRGRRLLRFVGKDGEMISRRTLNEEWLAVRKDFFPRWDARGERAVVLKRAALASLLRQEVKLYQESDGAGSVWDVYAQIEDAAMEQPNLSFPAIRRWLAWDLGMRIGEFNTRYKRARNVWRETVKRWADDVARRTV